MSDGWSFLVAGALVGLAGGFAPGPISMLVIVQSLRYGLGEGLKVAIAPLLTDAPVAIAALLVISRLDDASLALGVIALTGAAFLSYLAYQSLTFEAPAATPDAQAPGSLRKGMLTNLVNPNPYLFWFTVGAPTVVEAHRASWMFVGLFLAGLYVCLIGAKVTFAVVAARGRSFLQGTAYRYTLRALGVGLFIYALKFVRDGLGYLGVT
ncbi:MAG: LysE family transporter [Dehalococcoidia bacterium]|jgi:threonine/homoserine/homoserine lactone efflux protein|nr:LysE family transporter [Dehalococcoidia bacterium]